MRWGSSGGCLAEAGSARRSTPRRQLPAPLLRSGRGRREAPGEGPAFEVSGQKKTRLAAGVLQVAGSRQEHSGMTYWQMRARFARSRQFVTRSEENTSEIQSLIRTWYA